MTLKRTSIAGLLLLSWPLSCDKSEEKPTPTPAPSAAAASPPSASAAPTKKPPSHAPEQPLNVLFLSVDSLRADMPWTGYDKPIAPNLEALAKTSVVYENAYSTAPYTAQSVAAWLSGRYASTLYRAGWFFASYAKGNEFFTEQLQQQGVRTLGWHAHMYFARGKNLDQGFDVWELVPGIRFDPQTDNSITSEKMTKLGIEILSKPENTKQPFFAWAHYMDPHDVYNKHADTPDFGKNNRGRYDSEVHHTDQWIGKLLDFAKKQPWWKNTAVIITGDHGEAFGEHDMWKHAFEVWEVLHRVPLIVHAPGAEARHIKERRSLIDLAPTFMELLGKKPLDSFQGKSLVPEIYGKQPESREPIVLELAADSHNPPRQALISGDYKLIVYGSGWKHMLFNLKADPEEKEDLAKKEPEQLEKMKKLLEQSFEKLPAIKPYGGMKLKGGGTGNGPQGPVKKAGD